MKSFITETPDDIREGIEIREKTLIKEGMELYGKFYKKRYPRLGEMFDDPVKARIAAQTCILLENQARYLSKMNEATITAKFGDIAPRILDILRISYVNQIAHEIVDVQTMKSTHDIVYFIRPVYSKAKTGTYIKETIAQGTEAFGSGAANYATEQVEDLINDVGDHQNFKTTPSYDPLRPKTVFILYGGEQVASDDGNGNISGSVNISGVKTITGTVNYNGGADAIQFALSAAVASDPGFSVEYRYDSEASPEDIGGVDIVFGTFPVVARAHKLELKWSVDAALTATANVGIDVEDNLSIFAAQELKAQQDKSLVKTLLRGAGTVDANLIFNATNPSSYYTDYMHAQGLRLTLAKGDSRIFETTGRGNVSWYIVGNSVEEYMSYLEGYTRETEVKAQGVFRVGTYKGKAVYKADTSVMATDEFLVGYKGSIFGDAGCILAKYIEIYATPTIELSDFIGRKGIASFYDKKLIVSTYYKRGQITNIP